MASKFMKVRKVAIPMLTLVAILAQTGSAFALSPSEMTDLMNESPTVTMELAQIDAVTMASPSIRDGYTFTAMGNEVVYAANNQTSTPFNDLKGYEWASSAINAMASKDVVVGVGEGKFAPASNVTRQEFALMAIRAMGGNADTLAQQASEKAKTDSNYTSLDTINAHANYKGNWSNEVICAIQMFSELDGVWGISKEAWETEANRAEMAFIVMTIAEQLGTEKFEVKDGIENNVGDYNIVNQSPYKAHILKAYSNGILVGTDSQGSYSPYNNAKRAEAAVIMQRAMDSSTRSEVVVKQPEKPVVPPVQEGDNVGKYATYPKEGDVINGKTVTRDAETGILGLDVKGGIYLGITMTNGVKTIVIKEGSYANDDYDNMASGDQYGTKHGYTFWGSEFEILDKYARNHLPAASKAYDGQKADIKGNILSSGSSEPAFYQCVYNKYMTIYKWVSPDQVSSFQ